MSKKEKTMHCPNCGAPIRSAPASGSVVKCDYCDSIVNVPDFFPPKPAPPPAPKSAPVVPAPKPPVPPPVDFAPKAPVPEKKRKGYFAQLGEILLSWLIAAATLAFAGYMIFNYW